MIFDTIITITCILFLIMVFFKLFIQKRYKLLGYVLKSTDTKGNPCTLISYSDKFKPEIQTYYFYEYYLNNKSCYEYIDNLNSLHRKSLLIQLFRIKL